MFGSRRKTPLVPDPGQRVRLVAEDGSRRDDFRAVSGPLTSDTGAIVALIVTEQEYRDAKRERRRAVGIPWPVQRIEVLLPQRRWRWFNK